MRHFTDTKIHMHKHTSLTQNDTNTDYTIRCSATDKKAFKIYIVLLNT